MEKGHAFFVEKNIVKMPYAKIRGTRFDVPGDREKRWETRKKKVRKQQVGVICKISSAVRFARPIV